jgi:hypothetical protein
MIIYGQAVRGLGGLRLGLADRQVVAGVAGRFVLLPGLGVVLLPGVRSSSLPGG